MWTQPSTKVVVGGGGRGARSLGAREQRAFLRSYLDATEYAEELFGRNSVQNPV